MTVLLGQGQRGQKNRVVDLLERLWSKLADDKHRGFLLVHRQPALIEALVRREHRLIPQESIQKRELRGVSPEDDEANRQRRGDEEADRPPQPCPEDRRDQHGQRGHAGGGAIENGLQHVVRNQLNTDEQYNCPDKHAEAGIDRQRDEDGE